MSTFTRIRNFAESNYLLALAFLSAARFVIEIPLIHKIIETSPLHLLVEPLGYQLFIYAMIAAILSGIHLNSKKLQIIEADLGNKVDSLRADIKVDFESRRDFLPRIHELTRDGELDGFSSIAERVVKEQTKIFSNLSEGKLSVQLELMGKMQRLLIDLFHRRMDAVSHADLKLWENINQTSSNIDQDGRKDVGQFDKDLGLNYYYTTLDRASLNGTELTRIFLLDRKEVIKEKQSLAAIFKQHIDDKVGIALVFFDNVHGGIPTEWLSHSDLKPSEPRLDFALFNGDKAATYFRKNRERAEDRFEAVFNKERWAELILGQREIHKTLLIGSVFATQRFFESIFGPSNALYNATEKSDIKKCIEYLRVNVLRNSPTSGSELEELFSVALSTAEYDDSDKQIDLLVKKIELAVSKSKLLPSSISRFKKLIRMANHLQEED